MTGCEEDSLMEQLEKQLFQENGPIMTGKPLWRALGYSSGDAFRQAVCRKTIPIPIFAIELRRGKFALTKDVAIWIVKQRPKT